MTATSHSSLVSSSDVNGTNVYSRDGTHIGSIDHLTIDKQSGKVAYAVMGFGGFLGLGEDHHPVPWGKLEYDTTKEGFVTDITEEQVKGAPTRTPNRYRSREPGWDTKPTALLCRLLSCYMMPGIQNWALRWSKFDF